MSQSRIDIGAWHSGQVQLRALPSIQTESEESPDSVVLSATVAGVGDAVAGVSRLARFSSIVGKGSVEVRSRVGRVVSCQRSSVTSGEGWSNGTISNPNCESLVEDDLMESNQALFSCLEVRMGLGFIVVHGIS